MERDDWDIYCSSIQFAYNTTTNRTTGYTTEEYQHLLMFNMLIHLQIENKTKRDLYVNQKRQRNMDENKINMNLTCFANRWHFDKN